MITRSRILALAAAAALLAVQPAAGTALKIGWSDLRPATAGQPASGLPAPAPAGDILSWSLGGKSVELSGYALPTDREGDLVYQFMLVPWIGACSHMPTPPANQMVLITLSKPQRLAEAYQPVSVSGTLQPGLEKTQLFIIDGVVTLQSGYQIDRASVGPWAGSPAAGPPVGQSPWRLLRQ